jgi:hypothetical protein
VRLATTGDAEESRTVCQVSAAVNIPMEHYMRLAAIHTSSAINANTRPHAARRSELGETVDVDVDPDTDSLPPDQRR